MAFRDREMLAGLFKAYGCNGFEFFGLQARLSQLRGTAIAKQPACAARQQLFGISADTALKSRAERKLAPPSGPCSQSTTVPFRFSHRLAKQP